MRKSKISRVTKETDINIIIDLDGKGNSSIDTEIPFLDHMLTALSKHSGFDMTVKVRGDIEVDFHHTIEDTGIALGEVFLKALGDKKGIERFGSFYAPLDEALSRVVLDISGRPFIRYDLKFTQGDDGNKINPYLWEEFFRGFANSAKLTLHIDSIEGRNSHHIIESAFKAFARSLKQAVKITGTDIPSTKGTL